MVAEVSFVVTDRFNKTTKKSMKTITSAALPILLQIAAAEGIATKFALAPRHPSLQSHLWR